MNALLYILLFIGPFAGGVFALGSSAKDERTLKLFLSFAGAYLFAVTVVHLIPETFARQNKYTGLLVLAGFLFQLFLEYFSEGIEHGHVHVHHHLKHHVMPLGILASLCLHSFMEGIPLGGLFAIDSGARFPLLGGIMLHEFPAAFTLMSILRSIEIRRNALFALLLFYALMAPLGAASSIYASIRVPDEIFSMFMAFVIGTFLHISTTILFENSEQHHMSTKKLYAVVAGLGMALLTLLF